MQHDANPRVEDCRRDFWIMANTNSAEATRCHRLAAAMAYEGAIFEAELCAYQLEFVEGKDEWPANLVPTIETLQRIAQAIADAESRAPSAPVESMAAWAHRVLDAWADKRGRFPPVAGRERYGKDDQAYSVQLAGSWYYGTSRDAARISAALALREADPSLPAPPEERT